MRQLQVPLTCRYAAQLHYITLILVIRFAYCHHLAREADIMVHKSIIRQALTPRCHFLRFVAIRCTTSRTTYPQQVDTQLYKNRRPIEQILCQLVVRLFRPDCQAYFCSASDSRLFLHVTVQGRAWAVCHILHEPVDGFGR